MPGCDRRKVKNRSVPTAYPQGTMSHPAGDKDHGCSGMNMLVVLDLEFDFAAEVVWIFVAAAEEADDLVCIMGIMTFH